MGDYREQRLASILDRYDRKKESVCVRGWPERIASSALAEWASHEELEEAELCTL